jgi:ankyrin repeat protein
MVLGPIYSKRVKLIVNTSVTFVVVSVITVYKEHFFVINMSDIDTDKLLKIVKELKKNNDWKRIQWKTVAEIYLEGTDKHVNAKDLSKKYWQVTRNKKRDIGETKTEDSSPEASSSTSGGSRVGKGDRKSRCSSSECVRVPEDCPTINEAYARIEQSKGALTTIVLGSGDHVVEENEDGQNYLNIESPVNIVGSPKVLDKSKIVVVGGFWITANGAHVEHLTIRHKNGIGVRGYSSCTLTDLMIVQCRDCGVYASGSDAVLNCTNITVSKCKYSGVWAQWGGTIILRGNRTLITDNCILESIYHYGLNVCEPSSKIQIVKPLTKEAISKGNKEGRNWGAWNGATLDQIETIFIESIFNEKFFEACREGKIKLVTSTLNDHPEIINQSDKNGATPLFMAWQNGHLDIVRVLLASNAIQINQPDEDGVTPLFMACQNGHLDIVRVLLASNAIEINQPKKDGATPLLVACKKGHLDVVRVLLASNGIEINQPLKNGVTPLFMACALGHLDVVRVLLESNAIEINQPDEDGVTPLFMACQNGHLDIVRVLLASNAIEINQPKKDGATPLFMACKKGHLDVVRVLLQSNKIQINQACDDGATPLYIACQNGHLDIVNVLLQSNKIEINQACDSGATPLYIACQNGHLDIVNVLLQSNKIEINQPGDGEVTPLYIACQNGHLDIVNVLLQSKNIEINQPCDDGATPLYIACQEGHLDIVNVLLQSNKIQINQACDIGSTPLLIASHEGHLDIVNVLLQSNKIEINQSNNNGETPLFIACQNGHLNVVKALLSDFERYNTTRWGYCTLERNYNYIFDDMPTDISQTLTDLYTNGSLISEIERKDGFFHMKKRVKKGETAFLGIRDDFWKGTIPDVITLTLFGLARLTPDDFQSCKFPDETFQLDAYDLFSQMDGIDCPVRCLPCKHPFEAASLQQWFKTSIPGYNRKHTECPECKKEPESIEMMTEIQVKRWNAMAAMEDNADKDLKGLRKLADKYEPLKQKNAKLREEEQKISEVNKEIQRLSDNNVKLREKKDNLWQSKTKISEVLKEIQRLSDKKVKLREKKDKLWQAKTKTEKEVSKLNESLPQYNTYVKTRKEATDAQAKNKLTNRFKDSTTLKF